MTRTFLSIVTIVAMLSTCIPIFAFASEQNDNNEMRVPETSEEVAEVIENAAGTADVVQDVRDTNKGYVIEDSEAELVIPEEGDGEVEITNEDGAISMELPNDFFGVEGGLTDNGTVVYCDKEDKTALAVQGVQETEEDVCVLGFRSLITINTADAANEYAFRFDLPEGYEIVSCDEGACIVNNNSTVYDETTGSSLPDIVGVIEPAWAKDALGNEVDTGYYINGDTIVQKIAFDENSVFPIVADPKYRTVKEYKKTITGTKYDTGKKSTAKKKCDYNIAVYNIIRKPLGKQGKSTVIGKEGRWTWWGYKKVKGKWKYVKSMSGVTRTNKGPDSLNDWYQYLGGLGEF